MPLNNDLNFPFRKKHMKGMLYANLEVLEELLNSRAMADDARLGQAAHLVGNVSHEHELGALSVPKDIVQVDLGICIRRFHPRVLEEFVRSKHHREHVGRPR